MRRSNPAADAGSAAVEVLVLGVLLLVPLVYAVLTLSVLQAGAFAAEGAARQAARGFVLAPDEAAARTAAAAAARVALADWRVPPGAATVRVRCEPDPADCLRPRGTVRVAVRVAVTLPLLPPVLAVGAPGSIPVDAVAAQRVSVFRPAP